MTGRRWSLLVLRNDIKTVWVAVSTVAALF